MSYGQNPMYTTVNYSIVGRDEFDRLREEFERLKMSIAIWCDPGNHAFSGSQEGYEQLQRTKTIRENGVPRDVTVQIHICADHMEKLDPFGDHPDPDKTKALEAWNEGFQEGRKSVE